MYTKHPEQMVYQDWFLRDFAAFLDEPICAIFRASIREGHVPNVWKTANVLPLAKVHPSMSADRTSWRALIMSSVNRQFQGQPR